MDHSIEQMKQDLALARYAKGTQERYMYEIKRLSARFGRPVASLTRDEIRIYAAEVAGHTDSSHLRVRLSALKFLYCKTVGRPEMVSFLSYVARKSKVPTVLSLDEVRRLLEALEKPRYRAIAMVMYGAGLRISEALHLEVTDIDGARGVIHIRHGKGDCAREAKLSASLYAALRQYWACNRPPLPYLFASRKGKIPNPSSIRDAFARAAEVAGIKKHVTPHVLRHSFATHLLEEGTDVHVVGALLGHANIQSTTRYARVTQKIVRETPSPLDLLPQEMRR